MFKEIKSKPIRYTVISIYYVVIFFCALEVNFLGLFGYSPSVHDIQKPNMRYSSELYSADGKLLARYYKENRISSSYQQLPASLIHALIATEDVRFFEHGGIDFWSVLGSTISTASGDKRGGSTITQQLAKNLYHTRNKQSQGLVKYIPLIRTLVFKLKEWVTALKLESNYSKEEILSLYFNTVSFGNNTYGIRTAAMKYFNKEPQQLQATESAMLIGLLKAPSTYNPLKNRDESLNRRNIVLSQMKKYGYLSLSDYITFIKKPIELHPGQTGDEEDEGSYLGAAAAKFLNKWCEENNYDLYEDGLKIYTTIDAKLQDYAEEAVIKQMKILQQRFSNSCEGQNPWRDSKGNEIDNFIDIAVKRLPWYTSLEKKCHYKRALIQKQLNQKKPMHIFSYQGEKKVNFSTIDSIRYYTKMLNTGMLVLDPFNGKIKVWVGGVNFKHFKYDHVHQARRQAGSTFKPFAYLAALESGMSPCDQFIDKPVKISYQEGGKMRYWEPHNASYTFSGRSMSLRLAMAKSVNSITAQVTEHVGWDKVVKYAHLCGIESPLKSVPSVSLGSNDISVYEMVKAYATFLNKGIRTDPILVEKITDHDGHVLKEFKPQQLQVLDPEIAWLMLYMLRGSMEEPEGTSQALWEYDLWKANNQIAGKTGTSSDYVDGWYIGMTKDLVAGVWVGFDNRSIHFKNSATGEGSHTALPIFGRFMEKVYHDPKSGYTYGPFPKPDIKINRSYYCPSLMPVDTAAKDSTHIDSLITLSDKDSILDAEKAPQEDTEEEDAHL